MIVCLLTACGSESPSEASTSSTSADSSQSAALSDVTESSEPEESSQNAEDSTQTDTLYSVFGSGDIKEYPIEYTGDRKTAEELANELSELTGLDFNITATKTDDGLIVDWAVDSTLIAGLGDREQKEEFHFFDHDSLSWFMMDSLCHTLTENLDAENIYYTMDGGKELILDKMSPVKEFPSDTPYMGSEFYFANADTQAAYQGFWIYPDGVILEINGEQWNLYAEDRATLLDGGPVKYDENAANLINADGSSGGGRVYFDENNSLVDSGNVLTYWGETLDFNNADDAEN